MKGLLKFFRKEEHLPAKDPHTDLKIEYTPILLEYKEATETDFFKRIRWPLADNLDEFDMMNYSKQIMEVCKHLVYYQFFSICEIQEIVELLDINVKGESKKAFKKLEKLHCIKYRHMPPNILQQIPDLINTVFWGEPIEIKAERLE